MERKYILLSQLILTLGNEFSLGSIMYQTIPAYFSPLQLREKGYDNPVEGKKAHGRAERESYGLITLSLVSAVTSWPWLERFRTVMISQALSPFLRAQPIRELVRHKFGRSAGSILAAVASVSALTQWSLGGDIWGAWKKGQRHLWTKVLGQRAMQGLKQARLCSQQGKFFEINIWTTTEVS